MFVIKENKTDMYIGSHSKHFMKLQIRDHAIEFKNAQEVYESLEMLRAGYLPNLDLEVISE